MTPRSDRSAPFGRSKPHRLSARRMPRAIVERIERFQDAVNGDQSLGRPKRRARCDRGGVSHLSSKMECRSRLWRISSESQH